MFLARLAFSRSPVLTSQTRSNFVVTRWIRNMSTEDKSEAQKNITKWASTDGHFRRQVSTFRDVIAKGGKFEPEKGGSRV